MRTRTDFAALFAGAVFAGVLTIVTVGDGSPANSGTDPTFDAYFLQALRGAAAYILPFFLIHLGLRALKVSQRWAYATLGSICALVAIASQLRVSDWGVLLRQGNLSQVFLVAVLFGAVMGFLYRWRASLEPDGDDPATLDRVLAPALAKGDGKAAPEHVQTPTAEYFNGPVQVRTSLPLMFVAALVAASGYGLALVLFGMSGEINARMQLGTFSFQQAVAQAFDMQLLTIGIMGMIAPLPFTVLVLGAHSTLKALGKPSYLAYAAAGAASPFVAVVLGPVGLFIAVKSIIPMLMAACLYRSMAGLEPKPVAEDIIVKDRRNLVGAGHVRRRYGRVLKG